MFREPGRVAKTRLVEKVDRLRSCINPKTGNTLPLAGSAPNPDHRVKIDAWCAARTVSEICAALMEAGVPVAPVRGIPEVAQDPHLWEREMLVKMDDPVAGEMYLPGATIKFSRTPARVGPVPTPGQHTDDVLGGVLGLDRAAIAALREAKAVA